MSLTTVTTPRIEHSGRRIESSWPQQLTKIATVTATSIGFGWFVNQLWNGPQEQRFNELPLAHRGAIAKRVAPCLEVPQAALHQHSCIAEIVAGSLGSVMTASPWPLALGALSCLPTVAAAEATCKATGVSSSQIALSEFTPEAQKFLIDFLSVNACYGNIPLNILGAYKIECEELVIVDPAVISVESFKKQIEEMIDEAGTFGMKKISCPLPVPEPKVPEMAFGGEDWKKYFGNIGTVPSLPTNIEEILNGPCPIWPGQKIKDTHTLTLIPQTLNGRPITTHLLCTIVHNPQAGGKEAKCKDSILNAGFRHRVNQIGRAESPASYWILMTREVLPNTQNKYYTEQATELQRYKGYEVPRVLEASAAVLMEYVKKGVLLYPHSQQIYTVCQETFSGTDKVWLDQVRCNGYPCGESVMKEHWFRMIVGLFSNNGLIVDGASTINPSGHKCWSLGLAAVRRL